MRFWLNETFVSDPNIVPSHVLICRQNEKGEQEMWEKTDVRRWGCPVFVPHVVTPGVQVILDTQPREPNQWLW